MYRFVLLVFVACIVFDGICDCVRIAIIVATDATANQVKTAVSFFHTKLAYKVNYKKLSSIEDRRRPTHRVTALPRPHALDSVAVAGLDRAAPHASPR